MSAQPVDPGPPDPHDPAAILAALPERERAFFVAQYRQRAQAAAEDLAAYTSLHRFLRVWSLKVIAVNTPGYYEDLEAAANGALETVPIEQALSQTLGIPLEEATAYWDQKVEQARAEAAERRDGA